MSKEIFNTLTPEKKPDIIPLEILMEGEEPMKGEVRCKGKCPSCGNNFKHIHKLGYICPNCKTTPKRFYIDLWWQGERIRIYSDKLGEPLDTYQRTFNLLSHIQYEIKHHIFDPTKYKASEIRKFLFENRITQFLSEKKIEEEKRNISPSYINSLKNYINNYFLPFFKGMDVRDISSDDIKNFYYNLPERKEKTIKNILDALKHFFRNLYQYEIIDKIPIFPKIRVPESIPRWTSIENQLKLLNAIAECHKPIFTFILFQGVRPSEARALKWKDLDLPNRIVIIRRTFSSSKIVERTKGRNIKPRLIHPFVYEKLKELQRGLPEAFVFINPKTQKHYSKTRLEDIFRKARNITGIDINLYAAGRHSVATNAALAGADMRAIRDYLGHADSRTTEIYTHLDVLIQKQIFEKCKVINPSMDRLQTVSGGKS